MNSERALALGFADNFQGHFFSQGNQIKKSELGLKFEKTPYNRSSFFKIFPCSIQTFFRVFFKVVFPELSVEISIHPEDQEVQGIKDLKYYAERPDQLFSQSHQWGKRS